MIELIPCSHLTSPYSYPKRLLLFLLQVPIIPADGTDGTADANIPIPEFIFTKHMAKEIDRLRTEVAGATFGFKISKSRASRDSKAENEDEMSALSLQELLQPKKKRKTMAKKAAAKPKAKATTMEAEDVEEIFADVEVGNSGSRKRWWIDDVLSALIHAAGLLPWVRGLCGIQRFLLTFFFRNDSNTGELFSELFSLTNNQV